MSYSRSLLVVLCWPELLLAGIKMNVSLCQLSDVRAADITTAKEEAGLVFSSVGVEIVWKECNGFVSDGTESMEPLFLIRLSTGKPLRNAAPVSLSVMGRAFTPTRGDGYMVDVYLDAVERFAQQHWTDPGEVLGLVMTHELGHLLLGPGHVPSGLMRASWRESEIDAVRNRKLRFEHSAGEQIRAELRARTDSAAIPRFAQAAVSKGN